MLIPLWGGLDCAEIRRILHNEDFLPRYRADRKFNFIQLTLGHVHKIKTTTNKVKTLDGKCGGRLAHKSTY